MCFKLVFRTSKKIQNLFLSIHCPPQPWLCQLRVLNHAKYNPQKPCHTELGIGMRQLTQIVKATTKSYIYCNSTFFFHFMCHTHISRGGNLVKLAEKKWKS